MNYDTEIQIHKNSIGSKTKLQESLLEAVQILHDGFIVNEKIPKTLECRIADDSKKDEGIYIVDYMNNKFEASCFLDETFNVNDIVCVLVPDGDFAKIKIIIGSSDGSGEGANWVTQEQLDQAVTTLQSNFQAGVDAIGAACTRKGSPPVSSSLEDTVAAIDAIQTGGIYATLEVNADGTYVAAEDPRGIDAYDIVVVSKDVGQPHTVVFLGPDGSVIKTQANVPYHGYATCTLLDGTLLNGLYFKGWNPQPTNITIDTICYPQYGDYIIDSGEINDDWETICSDCGAHYPLGSYKLLNLPNPSHGYTYRNAYRGYEVQYNPVSPFTLRMVKVAEGEDGSTSTWLSAGGIYISSGNTSRPFFFGGDAINDWRTDIGQIDQGVSCGRVALNNGLLHDLPTPLQLTIKPVTKKYRGFSAAGFSKSTSCTLVDKESIDKIQSPSVKELYTKLSAYSSWSGSSMETQMETQGIDYASIYVPTYTMYNYDVNYPKVSLRSICDLYNDITGGVYIDDHDTTAPMGQTTGGFVSNRMTACPFGFCL